ncbi:type III PLP-dependent enzyme [Actinomadura syzygii]|uniref:type III PLP-dependent enzyme n=1 Tax=Actinomadura syzygii TaxID=1427538 RepID=UPI0016529A6F|nr:type III PLP-dependent enzyme [Actinomadura syzygii]
MTSHWTHIADRFGTPAYVYDLDEVTRAHDLLRAALPQPSRLLYSLKANPHPAIVRTLTALGCGAEVCSVGELATALDAGAAPEHVQYTGPGKTDAEVAEAVKSGVRWFSVDSPTGLDQVTSAADRADGPATILLRVNGTATAPGQGLAMTGVPSQFGADEAWARRHLTAVRDRIAGFHLFQGTNLADEAALLAQFDAALQTAARLAAATGYRPRVLNLGGGFGVPFARSGALPRFPALADVLAARLDAMFPGWRDGAPAVVFESGRYLTAACGSLLTRVTDVKRSHGRPVVVLESGVNHLGGMSGLRRLPPIVPELVAGDGEPRATLREAIIAGPLCTPLDTWARSADVPELRPGDLVRVPNVGAYGLSASLLAFLGRPAPREVVHARGAVTEVSQPAVVRLPAEPIEGT